jgi:ribosome-binding factor A
MSRRTDMLASTIQREIAQMIMRDLDDPRLPPHSMPTVTRVKVSPDLSVADVYVTIMGSEGKQAAAVNALRHSAGLIRAKLTRSLSLRVAPYIKFHLDEELKKELALMDVLQKVHDENEAIDRRRAANESGNAGAESQSPASPTDTTDTSKEE